MSGEIRDKLATMRDNWRGLKGKAEKRSSDLQDSLQVRISIDKSINLID